MSTAVKRDLAALSIELAAACVGMGSLPLSPFEPPYVALALQQASGARSCAIGEVIAPCAPPASAVFVTVPSHIGRAASSLLICLGLQWDTPTTNEKAALISLASLAQHASVRVQLRCFRDGGVRVCDLAATFALDAPSLGVVATVPLPSGLQAGDEVRVCSVAYAGTPISSPLALPASAWVVSIVTPLTLPTPFLSYIGETPAITSDGTVFVPQSTGGSTRFCIFACDGTEVHNAWEPEALPLGYRPATSAIAVCEATGSLVLASRSMRRIVCLDLKSHVTRWSVDGSSEDAEFLGVAVLQAHGVVVAGAYNKCDLRCYSIVDGAYLCTVSTGTEQPVIVAAGGLQHPEAVFVSTERASVLQLRWNAGLARLEPGREVAAARETRHRNYRLLTVMPPVPGKSVSHLLVGTWGTPELLVISLPDCTLVHTHEMLGISTTGIAADPSGMLLVVCTTTGDASATKVLAWPLEGMPPLH
jgi:hypothetical protein